MRNDFLKIARGVMVVVMVALIGASCEMHLSVAGILVRPMRVTTLADLNPQMREIHIQNTGKQVEYINVTLKEVLHPGTPNVQDIPFVHQNPYAFGIAAAPSKLILQPGEHVVVRLVNLVKSTPTDRIYYVTFTPAIPAIEPVQGQTMGVHAGLTVVTAYGVLVIIRPVTPHPQLQVMLKDHVVRVHNEGNTTVVTLGLWGCPQMGDALPLCARIANSAHLVYPGTGFQVNLPENLSIAQVQLEQEILGNYTLVSSDKNLKSENSHANS